MSTPDHPRREHPNTYIVPDRSNMDEITRLRIQDQIVTAGMGGVLAEQPDPTKFQSVLDVGCGTGNWLIEFARTYPTATRMIGVDVSAKLVELANGQAASQQLNDRVQFRAMDALRMLEFPAESFDLVNQRYAMGWLRTLDWPKLLGECRRVCRPGGVVRLTESDMDTPANSEALKTLSDILFQAMQQAGHFFHPKTDGIISELAPMLERYGFENVQTRTYIIPVRGGTDEGQLFYEDIKYAFRVALPYLRKWTRVPDDYDAIYQQALNDIQQPDFATSWTLLTAWGNKPEE